MARPKAFDPASALAAAGRTFWRNGYEKTSIDDLMAETNVGRQSLYDTFGDKRALYLGALDAYRRSTQDVMRRLFASGRHVRQCFETILFGICEESRADHKRGCLLLSANLERDADDKTVAALVKRNHREVVAIFEDALLEAQRAGTLAANKNAPALAIFFVATIQGMRTTARAASDRVALRHVAHIALSALD
jgi:TetR/AcrR family transcriptional regulator, transcriptional repressor for nem operon